MNDKFLSLALRAWPEFDASTTALSNVIPLIQKQRGSFKDVNEEVLQEEIAAAAAVFDDSQDGTPHPQEVDVLGAVTVEKQQQQNPRDAMLTKRQELIRLVA